VFPNFLDRTHFSRWTWASSHRVRVLRNNGFDGAWRGFETIEKLQRKILDDAPER